LITRYVHRLFLAPIVRSQQARAYPSLTQSNSISSSSHSNSSAGMPQALSVPGRLDRMLSRGSGQSWQRPQQKSKTVFVIIGVTSVIINVIGI